MKIPAFRLRLPQKDMYAVGHTIYMDRQPVVDRAEGLADTDWHALCLHLTGRNPLSSHPAPAPPDDPAAWARMEAMMAGIEQADASRERAEPTFRKKGRR